VTYEPSSIFYVFSLFDNITTPTQPPIQWVLGALYLGIERSQREADSSPHQMPKLRMRGAIPSLRHTSSWRGVVHRSALGRLYFYLHPLAHKCEM